MGRLKNFYIFACVLTTVGIQLATAEVASAAPAQVIIIRHGEKPASGDNLSPRGYQRAQALVGFFENNPAVLQYGTPTAIYASDPGVKGTSHRMVETVTPLAESLGISIDSSFNKDDLTGLVNDILNNPNYDGKMVLICWEHTVIPEMASDFGWSSAPTTWDDSVFDRVWILNFSGNTVTSFDNIPEHLLPGDSSS